MLILITDFKHKLHSGTMECRGNIDVSLQIGIFQFMDMVFD